MKIKSIKRHLQEYSIFGKRGTTINHAFASAIAPCDIWDEKVISEAIKVLKQNPENDLICVYCGEFAETWDHVFGLVKNFKFSGYGHVVGNLVPCCKQCNSQKGNKKWFDFINTKPNSSKRVKILEDYFKKYPPSTTDYSNIENICLNELNQLENIKEKIFKLMKEADIVATKIRFIIKNK